MHLSGNAGDRACKRGDINHCEPSLECFERQFRNEANAPAAPVLEKGADLRSYLAIGDTQIGMRDAQTGRRFVTGNEEMRSINVFVDHRYTLRDHKPTARSSSFARSSMET